MQYTPSIRSRRFARSSERIKVGPESAFYMRPAVRDAECNDIQHRAATRSVSMSMRNGGLCKSREDNSVSFRDYRETISKHVQEVSIRMQNKRKE